MLNTNIVNHDVLSRFSRLLKSGRMAHAYLFAGPQGIGKSETALSVAKLLNCEQVSAGYQTKACEQCSACLRISSGNYPDIYVLDCGDAESIKIAQIRELIVRLQMRAFEAAIKICIIKDIENMTPESSNALLKTLEEPSKDTLMILTTSVPEENLLTVVSRCHLIKFFSSSVPVVRQQLMDQMSLDTTVAQCLAQFSQGSMSKAKDLNEHNFFQYKNEVIDNLILQESSDLYLKKILSDKSQLQVTLTVLLSWFRDLLILKSGGGQKHLVHPDRYDELLRLDKKYSFENVDGIIEEVVRALALLGENLNIKIPFILLREQIWAKL